MDIGNPDFPLSHDTLPVSISACPTDPVDTISPERRNQMESMSINLPANTPVSGMRQWDDRYQISAHSDNVIAPPTKCTSHQSSSGPKKLTAASDSMPRYAPATNFNNQNPGSGHVRLFSSLGSSLVKSNTSEIKDQAIEHKGTDLIKPLREGGIGLNEPNSRNFIISELGSEHPHRMLSSYQPIPGDFYESHLEKDMESWRHTINENSNQSFLTCHPERSRGQSSHEPAQIQPHPNAGCATPFFQQIGKRGSPPHNDFTAHSLINNYEMKSSKNQFKNTFSLGTRTQDQTMAPNVASFNRSLGIKSLAGNSLTQGASQVSLHNTVMTTTSMESQSIRGSADHLNISLSNPSLLKEPPAIESPLYQTYDLKQSVGVVCRNTATLDAFGKARPSHSADDRLLKDINPGDTFFDWNSSVDVDKLHLNRHHSQKISLNSKPDVINSLATELLCDISSISSDARYSHPEVDHDLIPGKLSQLDTDWAKKKWKFARCFDKMLPRENPSDEDAVSFYTILLKVYEFTSNRIADCLLEYYKKLCLRYNLSYNKAMVGDMIYQIQDNVMKSSTVYSDEYLRMCLLFMKYPFSYDFNWFRKAIRMVEEEYSIKVPVYPQNQNFVYRILDNTRLGVMNNRFRRVMLRQVGKVWYDKKQYKTKTVFGTNAVLCWESKSVFVESHIFRGYLVSIDGVSSDGMNMTKDVIRKLQEDSNSKEEFCQKMGEMFWNRDDCREQMPLAPVGSKLKTDPGQHTDHTGFGVRECSGYCPRIPPIPEQSNGSEQRSVLRPYTSDENSNIFDPAALGSYPSKTKKPNHARMDNGCSADQCFANQQPSFVHGCSSLTSLYEHEMDGKFQIQSKPTTKAKPNRIRSNKNGFEIEEQWIEEYQDWLIIRVDDRWNSNCKYIYIFDLMNQIMSTYHTVCQNTDYMKMKGKGN